LTNPIVHCILLAIPIVKYLIFEAKLMRKFVVWSLVLMLTCLTDSCSKNSSEQQGQSSSQTSSSQTSFSQQFSPEQPSLALSLDSTRYFFVGSVGSNSRVNAELTLHRAEIHGSYRYNTSALGLSVRGKIQANNTVELIERDDMGRGGWDKDGNKTVSGRLVGKLDLKQGTISGTWTSKNGKKSFPFVLRAVAVFKVLHHSTLDVSGDYPTFAAPELATLNDTLATLSKKNFASSVQSVDTMRQEYVGDETMKEMASRISEHSSISVVYAAPNLVSLLWSLDSYSGGAHGNYGFAATTWRISNSIPKRITLADLFQANAPYKKKLSELLLANR
jgi:hypothetical protein